MLHTLHPRLTIHFVQATLDEALPALLARTIDLVITEEYPGNPNPRPVELEQQPFAEEPVRLATPRPTDASATPTGQLRALAIHPWVMEPEGASARHWATAVCRSSGFEPNVHYDSTALLHLRLAEQEHAAAFRPDLAWTGHTATVALRERPEGQRTRSLCTVIRSRRGHHPTVWACRHALQQAISTHPGQLAADGRTPSPHPVSLPG